MRVERVLSYPADGLSVILPQAGVSLASDVFTPRGSRQMQDGRLVDIFKAEGFEPGQSLAFELSGQPQVSLTSVSSASSVQPATGRTLLPVGLVALGLALIGGGIWWWRRGAISPNSVSSPVSASTIDLETPEAALVLRAIAKLDEGYQAGIIPEEGYARQRTALRAELKTLLMTQRCWSDLTDLDAREVEAEIGAK